MQAQKHLDYISLSVGDVDCDKLKMIASCGPGVWSPLSLHVGSAKMWWDVMYAEINEIMYFKTINQYENREFEILFGFNCDKSFVSGKIVYVKEGRTTMLSGTRSMVGVAPQSQYDDEKPVVWNNEKMRSIGDAAQENRWEIVKSMALQDNSLANQTCPNNESILSIAVQRNQTDAAAVLLNCGAIADSNTANGEPLVIYAMRNGHKDMVEKLLSAGADRGAVSAFAVSTTAAGEALVAEAASSGNWPSVLVLLDYGADIRSLTLSGESLISTCVQQRSVYVDDMMRRGLAADSRRADGEKLFSFAVRLGYWNMVEKLMKSVYCRDDVRELAVSNTTAGESLVANLAFGNMWTIVIALIDAGADVHAHTLLGESLISIAVQRHSPSIDALLVRGATACSFTAKGQALVLFAAQVRHWDTVKKLIDAGVNMFSMSAVGSLMDIAQQQNNYDACTMLRETQTAKQEAVANRLKIQHNIQEEEDVATRLKKCRIQDSGSGNGCDSKTCGGAWHRQGFQTTNPFIV